MENDQRSENDGGRNTCNSGCTTTSSTLRNWRSRLCSQQAAETRLLPIAARTVAAHPEYQQVNRVGRDGVGLKGGWIFLVNTTTHVALRTVGDPEKLDFETAMRRAMPTV
jgi:hypothetical protein